MPLISLKRLLRSRLFLLLLCVLALRANAGSVLTKEDPDLIAFPAAVSTLDSDLMLDIHSLQHSWRIRLRPKSLLGSMSTVQSALYDIPEFFNGVVEGEADSWVRLARDAENAPLRGHLFSKGTLFELQYDDGSGAHSIARLSDADAVLAQNTLNELSSLSIRQRSLSNDPDTQAKAIRVGIVIDSRYNEQHNGRGLAHALGVMNGVDGLYQNQLGLAVVVEGFPCI